MKVLSIRQPWAWLIVNGAKPIENRTWRTTYRGQLLIHASSQVTAKDLEEADRFWRANFETRPAWHDHKFQAGGIIGRATLAEIVTSADELSETEAPWFAGPFGWVLADAKPLPFRPCKGRRGLWEIKDL